MFRANNFDKLLDKATSNLRLDPDWPTILQICDLIRQNDCSPKYAVAAVKKKLYSQNPHQAMFALLTLESIVKNCGSGIHDEVASKVFCEVLRDLVKTTQHENLRNKILELTQAWAFAFRNNPKYRAVQDTVNILKTEGYKFPPLKESDAMFSADTAPEWADGEVCHRCRVAFSLMVRRHHCRACGQVFCQQCSSKTSTLPKFGIEKEVRVCDACFDKVSRPPPANAKLEIADASNDYGPTQSTQKRPGKSAEELQEEEELQLALALSQSEAEHKEKERKSRSYIAPDPVSLHPTVSPSPSSVSASPEHTVQANPELSRYLDRNYWEQRVSRDTAAPTAPSSQSTNEVAEQEYAKPNTSKTQDDDAEDKEIDEFVETLKSQVEIFVNRMKSNSSRGRSIANDTSVQTLFMNITAMHSRLLRYIQQQDDKRVYLESLQDKVSQVRDSRAALDTLRAEHAARRVAEAEAAERQRQQQMAAKLHAMRKKKHEYLQYQRQLALQRVQEQEREMQMRQEQQKHQYMMSANSGYFMPGVSLHQYQPGYPNPIYGNPQFHSQMPQITTDVSMPLQGQTQMSQANMTMASQMGTMAQAMPPVTSTFAMHTQGPAVSQASANMPPHQPNIRSNIGQIQQQMMMQQMQQMRMPAQQGLPQMMPQNMVNGFPGQNMSQQNGQALQLPKQSLSNQPQAPNFQQPATSIGQQPNQLMLGPHMQNMRMPLIQSNQPNNQQIPVSGYGINSQNQQNNQQPALQIPNMQSQVPLPGQQAVQGLNQNMSLSSHIPTSGQNVPSQGSQVPHSQAQQVSQQLQQMNKLINQPMPVGQPQQLQGQQMNMQGLQMQAQGHNIPQHHLMNQGQQLPGQSGQHMLQSHQLSHGQTMPHAQNIPNQMQSGLVPQQMPHPQASQIQGPPTPHQLNQGQQIQQLPQNPQMGQIQNPSGQQQMLQGQHLPQGQIPQGQMPQGQIPQNQQLPMGQPMPQGQQVQQGQQQTPQNQQLPMGQPMLQGQQMQQGQQQMLQNTAGQPIKMQQPSVNVQPQSAPNQQPPVKAEHNNNTSELISFD